MGIVFGRTGCAEPSYSVLRTLAASNMEVRSYQAFCTAAVPYNRHRKGEDKGFMVLAKYIGVGSAPANLMTTTGERKPQEIAMTAPVLMEEQKQIAMTAPVLTNVQQKAGSQDIAMTAPVLMNGISNSASASENGGTMAFVMPFEYTDISQLPQPTDPRVTLHQIPTKVVATYEFSGWVTDESAAEKHAELRRELVKSKLINEDDTNYQVAQYHPPFTLPFMRRNEIWVQLDKGRAEVKALVASGNRVSAL